MSLGADTSLGAQTSADKSAHTSLGAQTSAHTSLGAQKSAHKSAHTSYGAVQELLCALVHEFFSLPGPCLT